MFYNANKHLEYVMKIQFYKTALLNEPIHGNPSTITDTRVVNLSLGLYTNPRAGTQTIHFVKNSVEVIDIDPTEETLVCFSPYHNTAPRYYEQLPKESIVTGYRATIVFKSGYVKSGIVPYSEFMKLQSLQIDDDFIDIQEE